METIKRPSKNYLPEVRERAVKMVLEHEADYEYRWSAIRSTAMITLGIVMDPIATINIYKNTSFALLLAAQQRGWQLHYFEPADLYLLNGEMATAASCACSGMLPTGLDLLGNRRSPCSSWMLC